LDHFPGGVIMLTARDGRGRVFTVQEVAILYYQALRQLHETATFRHALLALLDVAKTYFANPEERERKIRAIEKAYGSVGITV
jgi:Zn-dependent metalloprotease